jgi:hypothetical protein
MAVLYQLSYPGTFTSCRSESSLRLAGGTARPEPLERVRLRRVELEPCVDAVAAGALGDLVGVLALRVARRRLDEQWRQAGEVGRQRAHHRIVDRVVAEVGRRERRRLLSQDHDLLGGVGKRREVAPREVEPRAEEDGPAGKRPALVAQPDQQRHHQSCT